MPTVLTPEQLEELERMEGELREICAEFKAMLVRIERLRESRSDTGAES